MTKLFILGASSFIAKSFYLKIRTSNYPISIFCLSHMELDLLKSSGITSDDIVVNCCGVNRSDSFIAYMDGNYHFIEKLVSLLKELDVTPYLMHISSYLVHGLVDEEKNDACATNFYTQMFIESKLKGESHLTDNYHTNKLCIIRPSNIYGYSCEPYYNNILVTMIYESITNEYKITNINKNCIRNFLSVDGLTDRMIKMIDSRIVGVFNVISNNNMSLQDLTKIIHSNTDNYGMFDIQDGYYSQPNTNSGIVGVDEIIHEEINDKIDDTKKRMTQFLEIKQMCPIRKLNRLSQSRGDMVEISNLISRRLYMITVTQNSVRGNHYHYEQIEEFYVNRGKIMFVLAHADDPTTMTMSILGKYDSIKVNPYIIHTLVNDFIGDDTEVFVTSTQEFIAGSIPDTKYVNIL